MKTCTCCGIEKNETAFRVRGSGLNSWCKACCCEKNRLYYSVNKEKVYNRTNNYRKERLAIYKDYTSCWRSKQPKETLREAGRRDYVNRKINNPESLRLAWRKKGHKRRCNQLNVMDDYSICDEKITYQVFHHQCFNCDSKENLHIDHHYPLSKGFGLCLENAVLLCQSCNSSKKDKMPEKFYSVDKLSKLEYILAMVSCDDLGWY